MDGIDERRPSPEGASRNRAALDGDWSEGVPRPAHAHGLPSPEPIGLPAEREPTAPIAIAETAASEPAAEPAVEAPADWGTAADQAAGQPPADVEVEVEVAVDDDFPVILSEADEIHDEITAPIDVAPSEATTFEAVDLEAKPPDAQPAPVAQEPPPAPAEAASADWLAHPDARSGEGAPEAAAGDATPAPSWEEATYADSTLESAFAAAEAAQASAGGGESELAAAPAPTAAGALDAWGEPTVPPTASSDVEPWAAPVETPWEGSSAVTAEEPRKAPEIATPDEVAELTEEPPEPDWQKAPTEIASPAPAGELTEEPPEPDWAKGPRELFSPLGRGETLSEEGPPPAFEPARNTPPQLELVRAPETLEDSDLLVPVEDATPPMGVTPAEAAAPLIVPGEQRVAIQTRAGQTRRGTVTDLDLSQPRIPLEPQGGGPTVNLEHDEVKAIFFMLAPGEKAEAGPGQAVRVTFSDGRSIEGHRQPDESREGFFLVPLDAQKTNTRRIYVARDAVSEIVDLAQ